MNNVLFTTDRRHSVTRIFLLICLSLFAMSYQTVAQSNNTPVTYQTNYVVRTDVNADFSKEFPESIILTANLESDGNILLTQPTGSKTFRDATQITVIVDARIYAKKIVISSTDKNGSLKEYQLNEDTRLPLYLNKDTSVTLKLDKVRTNTISLK